MPRGSVKEERPKMVAHGLAELASKLELRASNARVQADALERDAKVARGLANQAAHVVKSLGEGWGQ